MKDKKSSQNAALMAGGLASGAGSGTFCLADNNSFVCQINRLVSTVQGIIFLGFVLFFIYYLIKNRKNSTIFS